jgi:hypothetical protein
MPRYFFHIADGGQITEDPEGEERPDLSAASTEAVETAREMIAQSVLAGLGLGLQRRILIADVDGRVLDEVPFEVVAAPICYVRK